MGKKSYISVKGYYPNNNSVKLGGHTITLKNCARQIGHDDSTPYAARLFVDNKLVCTVYNDGWGGESNAIQIQNKELLAKVNEDIQGLPFVIYPWDKHDTTFSTLTLSSIFEVCDCIAEHTLYLKDILKKRGAKKTIIALKGDEIRYATMQKLDIKNITVDDLIACQVKCNELIKLGYTIVNCPQFYVSEDMSL